MYKMSVITAYRPYENWKSFNILEEQGKKFLELYNYKLEIDEDNYVPKAGLLFENVLENNSKEKKVLDLGCGQMGILGLISLHYGAKQLLAVDIDDRCTKWLNGIIDNNNIKNITVLKSDMFSEIDNEEKFDLILSNPPHMPMEEGKLCDSGGTDGRKYLIAIIKEAFNHLEDGGELNIMMFDFEGAEKSYNNDKSIFELAREIGYKEMKVIFTFEKNITPGSVTYECLDYIKTVYPKYHFDENNPKCNLIINRLRK